MRVRQCEFDAVVEELLPPRRRQVVVPEGRDVTRLEEREVIWQVCSLDRGRLVAQLRDEPGDERQLRHERVARAVALHLPHPFQIQRWAGRGRRVRTSMTWSTVQSPGRFGVMPAGTGAGR